MKISAIGDTTVTNMCFSAINCGIVWDIFKLSCHYSVINWKCKLITDHNVIPKGLSQTILKCIAVCLISKKYVHLIKSDQFIVNLFFMVSLNVDSILINNSSEITEAATKGVLCKKVFFRNFTKFTGKHLYQSLFFNKVADLRPVNFVKFLLEKLPSKSFLVSRKKILFSLWSL